MIVSDLGRSLTAISKKRPLAHLGIGAKLRGIGTLENPVIITYFSGSTLSYTFALYKPNRGMPDKENIKL